MREPLKFDPVRYRGTAWYYSRFRPKYPPVLVSLLRENYGLDGTGRLLDLGCGPGPVAIRLAHLFEEVIAVDPEPEMLEEGRRQAERAGVANVRWVVGSSLNLPPGLGQFRLITMGNSFHWMDRTRMLDTLFDFVTDDGGLAVVGHGDPIPAPPPTRWRIAVNEVVRRYCGEIRVPWENDPDERHEAYLKRSRFKRLKVHEEKFEITWTVETKLGDLYSTSYCNRRVLGDRVDDFERDLRAAVLAVEPSGILTGEPPEFFALMVWKR